MESVPTGIDAAKLLDAALYYARRGFRVVPIHTWIDGRCTCDDPSCGSPAKHPLTPHGLADATTNEQTIRRWWTEALIANVAIVTGPESCCFMVGPDSDEGIRQLEDLAARFGELPLTMTERSGSGGTHHYFAWPPDCEPIKNSKNSGGLKLDVRGNGGYSICCPSINRNGRYEWVVPPDRCLPAPAPKWLVAFVRDPEGFLAQNGINQPAPAKAETNGHAGNGQLTLRVGTSPTIVDRARAYLAKVPRAISGQNGHGQCFWTACQLVLGFNLSPADAYPLLAEWNETCKPPWSEKELRHKLDSANQRPGERGTLLADNPPPATVVRSVAPAAPSSIQYRRLTCLELDSAEFKTEYLIERTLVVGQPCIVAGGKKSMKTSLLVDLGISLATAGFFLGKLRVTRAARTALMSGESGLPTLQETARRVARAAGHRLADVDGLIFSPDLPVFGDVRHTDAVAKFLAADAIEVVILDPAYLCVPTEGNEGSLFAVGKKLRAMSEVCESAGATMILAHHTRKGVVDPFQPVELEDISWAGFQEFARQWLLVSRRERYEPGSGLHRLWLNVGGSAGHSGLWGVDIDEGAYDGHTPRRWEVDVRPAEEVRGDVTHAQERAKETKHEEQRDRAKKLILAALAKFPDGESKTTIRERTPIGGTRFNTPWAELIDEGEIVPCGRVQRENGQSYEAFKLAAK